MTKEEKILEAIKKIEAEPEEVVEPKAEQKPVEVQPNPEVEALKTKVANLEKQLKDGMLGVSSANAQQKEVSNFKEIEDRLKNKN